MPTIKNTEFKPVKLSEIASLTEVADNDKVVMVHQGYERNAEIGVLKKGLGVPTLSDSLTLERSDVASSSLASSTLQKRIESLRSTLTSLEQEMEDIKQSVTEGFDNLEVDWNQLVNIPDIVGTQGKPGKDGRDGRPGTPGRDGVNGNDGKPGNDGKDGENGIDGQPGENGTYMHIRYSKNENGNPMTTAKQKYIGILVSRNRVASLNFEDYTWTQLEGVDGENGIPGGEGEDGKTYYWHIKYGTGYDVDNNMVFTENNGELPGDWLGQYVNEIQADSMNPADYSWSYIKGETGAEGATGLQGPMTFFSGVYSDTETYIGDVNHRSIVKWFDGEEELYYITVAGVGSFKGIKPSNSLYWNTFDFTYKSIATELLFAEGANIAGWQFFTSDSGDQILKSQTNGTILNGTTGEISAISGGFKVNKDGSGNFAKENAKWKPDGSLVLLGNMANEGSTVHIGNEEKGIGSWEYGQLHKNKLIFKREAGVAGANTNASISPEGFIFNGFGCTFDAHLGHTAVVNNDTGDPSWHLKVVLSGIPDLRTQTIRFGTGWDGFGSGALYIGQDGELKIS